MLSFVKKAVTY